MCFFAGGTRFSEQGFGVSERLNAIIWSETVISLIIAGSVQINSSLLTISVIAVLLPAAFHFAAGSTLADPSEGRDILAVSHGVSASPLVSEFDHADAA